MVGDVNIHLDYQTLHHTVKCIQPWTDIEAENIILCNDDGDLIRDHYSIVSTIQQSTPLQKREIVSYRNVKQINNNQFCKDVSESPTLNNTHGTITNLLIDIPLD